MAKRKAFNGTLAPFKRKIIKQLKSYYYQGGHWYILRKVKGVA